MCECPFSQQGYLCKHVIKVNLMKEELRKEIELEYVNRVEGQSDGIENSIDENPLVSFNYLNLIFF